MLGVVRYVGSVQFGVGTWIGVQLDEAVGNSNGIVDNVTYFRCKMNHGLFVPIARAKPSSTANLARDVDHPSSLLDCKHASPQDALKAARKVAVTAKAATVFLRTRTAKAMQENFDRGSTARTTITDSVVAVPLASKVRVLSRGVIGTLRFLGQVKFGEGQWAGVQLPTPTGTSAGTVDGTKYFGCKPDHGVFVLATDICLVTDTEAKVTAESPHGELRSQAACASKLRTQTAGKKRGASQPILVHDRVTLDGKQATVSYVGPLADSKGDFLGLQFDEPVGKHDGTLNQRTYFHCPPMSVL